MRAEKVPELLPCPLCGSDVRLIDLAGWEIQCWCGLNFAQNEAERDSLIAAWNRRQQGAEGG